MWFNMIWDLISDSVWRRIDLACKVDIKPAEKLTLDVCSFRYNYTLIKWTKLSVRYCKSKEKVRVEGWRGFRCDESDAGHHKVMKTITAKQPGRPLRRPDSGDGTRVWSSWSEFSKDPFLSSTHIICTNWPLRLVTGPQDSLTRPRNVKGSYLDCFLDLKSHFKCFNWENVPFK